MTQEIPSNTRYGREFGFGTAIGDHGDSFLSGSLRQQRLAQAWSEACSVREQVTQKYGEEWARDRYLDCNL